MRTSARCFLLLLYSASRFIWGRDKFDRKIDLLLATPARPIRFTAAIAAQTPARHPDAAQTSVSITLPSNTFACNKIGVTLVVLAAQESELRLLGASKTVPLGTMSGVGARPRPI